MAFDPIHLPIFLCTCVDVFEQQVYTLHGAFCYARVLFWPQYIDILFSMWWWFALFHYFLDFSDSLKQAKLKKGKA